jgi:hypothetical protein
MTSRQIRSMVLKTSLAAFILCAAALFGQSPSFVSFNAPHAGTGSSQGTIGSCINQHGVIGGYYIDSANAIHGFVRDASGTITEFDPPGITDGFVQSINSLGQITGVGTSNHGTTQGFVRQVNGHFVHVMVPGSQFTQPWRINDNGVITGVYGDSAGVLHGFTFTAGAYATIDDPDATESINEGTLAVAINIGGAITGYYGDDHIGGMRAFVRDGAGNFTNFDAVPGGSLAVFPVAINEEGQIAGSYYNSDGGSHSFIRDALGTITDFDVTGATGTRAVDMNDTGMIVGQWTNGVFTTQGFLRSQTGAVIPFSAPVPNIGTFPFAINNSDRITGSYFDLSGVSHGFVR